MAKEKSKGKNYSIYFKKHQSEFIDAYISDVSSYFQSKVEQDMVDCEEFFNKNITRIKRELKKQNELLLKARENKKLKEKSFKNLREQYINRQSDKRDSFLDGATGRKLLQQSQLTKFQFKEKIIDMI